MGNGLSSAGKSLRVTGAFCQRHGWRSMAHFSIFLSFLVLLISNYYFSLMFSYFFKNTGKGSLVGDGR